MSTTVRRLLTPCALAPLGCVFAMSGPASADNFGRSYYDRATNELVRRAAARGTFSHHACTVEIFMCNSISSSRAAWEVRRNCARTLKPIVQFALATGCRAGEIHGLEWSRVDLARKVAWLDHGTTKSGEGRGIPLNAHAVAALEATGSAPALVFHLRWPAHPPELDGLGQGEAACRHRGLPFPRPEAHLGLLARAERYLTAGADGAGRLEVVRDGAALCAPAPEKLSSVASRIERQPAVAILKVAPRGKNVADHATFSLRLVN